MLRDAHLQTESNTIIEIFKTSRITLTCKEKKNLLIKVVRKETKRDEMMLHEQLSNSSS